MPATFPLVPLGEVLTPVSRSEKPGALKEYSLLGVRLDGQGPFLREKKLGSQIAGSILYKVEAGDFIYSRLFAWRGAFGLIDVMLDGCYVSGEFPLFRATNGKVDLRYLNYWFRIRSTLEKVEADCTGSTPLTRNRFKEEFFLRLQIPLPPLDEQRRIVARIEELAAKIEEAKGLRKQAVEEVKGVAESARRKLFERASEAYPSEQLGNLIKMESGDGLISSSLDDSFEYPVYGGGGYVGRYSSYIVEESTLVIGRVGARCGCVFISEPKAWITDNALYVTEMSEQLGKVYLMHALTFLDLRQSANQAAQPVVSQKKINPQRIPVPPIDEQRRIVAYLDGLQSKVDALKQLQSETQKEIDSLLPSVLDKAFKGEL